MSIKLILCVILLRAGTYSSVFGDDSCSTSDKANLPSVKLKDQLLCGYDNLIRPVKNHLNATKIYVKMILKYMNFEEEEATISVDSWLSLVWTDQHLKWNPKDHDGITQIHLTDNDIWMPDLSLYNRASQEGSASIINTVKCPVLNTGVVSCVVAARSEALCIPDTSRFPYDTQNCSLRFGSWVHSGEELNLQFSKPPVYIEDAYKNRAWKLITVQTYRFDGKYKCCPNNTYPSLQYSFEISRFTATHTVTIIIPAFVLLVMTLTSLWIAPNHSDRLNLCYVNIINQFLYIQYISWMIPTHGDTTPLLMSYARDSMLLCCFTIVLTVILRNLITGSGEAPALISLIVSFVIGCRVGEIILLNDYSLKGVAAAKGEDDGSNIINNGPTNNAPKESQDWLIFAKMLDRLCFIIYFIVYLFMFIGFAP